MVARLPLVQLMIPIRHSISKLSHLHFPVHKVYKKRLMQLGENPKQFLIMVD